jgi:hypothetical protein
MRAIAIGAFMALGVTAAGAVERETTSANYWLPGCKAVLSSSTRNTFDAAHCMGFVEGLAYLLNAAAGTCKPVEVTVEQATRVIVRYIEARPQADARTIQTVGNGGHASSPAMSSWREMTRERPRRGVTAGLYRDHGCRNISLTKKRLTVTKKLVMTNWGYGGRRVQ